jgi:hypothetical protein
VTNGRSATNPRAYLWDKTLNINNMADFQTQVLAKADFVLRNLNQVYPKPQGILIWDLEGQEFSQPFSYIGSPDKLPLVAPEMDAVADQLMAKFTNAGYKVGLTVRPNHFMTGTTLPATCITSSNYSLQDKFIKLDDPYPHRGYTCTAPNVWTNSSANGPSAQTTTQDYNEVLNQLRTKISYARTRWGATMFYVDSDVWEGGAVLDPSIFRELATEFPDCLLIPEMSNTYHFGGTGPYEQTAQVGYYGTSQTRKDVYPEAFGVVNMANANWNANFNRLLQAVVSGDILMFEAWWSSPEIPVVQQLYGAAAAQRQQQ